MSERMRKYISTVLVFMLTVLTVLSVGSTAQAEEAQKTSTTRAVYVVYDNSGSMYGEGNKAWSHAAYAMEVFSAMMNFENGDVMKIFLMHDVTTDGTTDGKTTSSITIASQDDIQQIHNMYTPRPRGTSYIQVNNANKELNVLLDNGTANEGWLVVLTDGDFDSDVPENGVEADLADKAKAKENIYVQYIAMGTEIEEIPEGNEEIGFYSQKVENSAEVVDTLVEINSRIFKRSEYENYEAGAELTFDLPLGKVIVFAQGAEVNINGLKGEAGSDVNLQNITNVSYNNTAGAGFTGYVEKEPVKDTSLNGQVAVFSDMIEAGKYTLDVSGADTIQIYYEQDENAEDIALQEEIDTPVQEEADSTSNVEEVEPVENEEKTIIDFAENHKKELVIALILLIVILGYVPPFKKRFPGNMKKRPNIESTAEKTGLRDMVVKGRFEKNILSVVLPYKAETGRLVFSPTPVKKIANVRAAGHGNMVILNTKKFAGREEITFNGTSIPEDYTENYKISSSTAIVVSTPEYTYTCIPNVQKTLDGKRK